MNTTITCCAFDTGFWHIINLLYLLTHITSVIKHIQKATYCCLY